MPRAVWLRALKNGNPATWWRWHNTLVQLFARNRHLGGAFHKKRGSLADRFLLHRAPVFYAQAHSWRGGAKQFATARRKQCEMSRAPEYGSVAQMQTLEFASSVKSIWVG